MSNKRRNSERSKEVAAIKKQGRNRHGRGVPLPGLWACRVAAGLTQRELAMLVKTSQGTITSLENQERGAYPRTINRLCATLGVRPVDLFCADATEEA